VNIFIIIADKCQDQIDRLFSARLNNKFN